MSYVLAKKGMASIIVACDLYGGIGRDGAIPWHIPADMRRFREITLGNVVIMGRRTWESIPDNKRPLPGRVNIVIRRNPPDSSTVLPNLFHATSLTSALEFAKVTFPKLHTFVIGGQRLYDDALELDLVDHVHLTLVHEHVRGCDVFFPLEDVYCSPGFSIVEQSPKKECGAVSYSFITLTRCRTEESSAAGENPRLL